MQKTMLLCEGKSKQVFATDEPGLCVLAFKDEATAYYGLKRQRIADKGAMNNRICEVIFRHLSANDIPTHFVRRFGEREMLVRQAENIPVFMVIRNFAAGNLCERTGMTPGLKLQNTVVECRYKNDELGKPLLNHTHIAAMGLGTAQEMERIRALSLRVNELLRGMLGRAGIDLIDFKLEFGRVEGQIVLADEITPDTCRIWDSRTHEPLDLDRFRQDLGQVQESYHDVLARLMACSQEIDKEYD